MEKFLKLVCISFIVLFHFMNNYTQCCNESVCGSIVSKCLLMQLCRCTPGNYTCSKECYYCLKGSYSECCSCVDLCDLPEPYQNTDIDSYVGILDNSVPGLFQALAEEETDWTSETFQIHYHIGQNDLPTVTNVQISSNMNDILENEGGTLTECTVMFMNNCTSVTKCEKMCSSMGSSGFRWFHDGCCECVGEHCLNFGLKESRCRYCSYNNEIDWEDSENFYHFPDDNNIENGNDLTDVIW